MMDDALLYEYTKNHWILSFKGLNFKMCAFYMYMYIYLYMCISQYKKILGLNELKAQSWVSPDITNVCTHIPPVILSYKSVFPYF